MTTHYHVSRRYMHPDWVYALTHQGRKGNVFHSSDYADFLLMLRSELDRYGADDLESGEVTITPGRRQVSKKSALSPPEAELLEVVVDGMILKAKVAGQGELLESLVSTLGTAIDALDAVCRMVYR